MSNPRWKNKSEETVREISFDDPARRPEIIMGKLFISICAGFVTSMIAMLVVNQINWLFVIPLSVAALLIFAARQK